MALSHTVRKRESEFKPRPLGSRVQRDHHSALPPLMDVGHTFVSDGDGVGKEGSWSPWEDGKFKEELFLLAGKFNLGQQA